MERVLPKVDVAIYFEEEVEDVLGVVVEIGVDVALVDGLSVLLDDEAYDLLYYFRVVLLEVEFEEEGSFFLVSFQQMQELFCIQIVTQRCD